MHINGLFALLTVAIATPVEGPKYDTAKFDNSVRPGDNFYNFVNNFWLANATIRDDKTSTSPWDDLIIVIEERVHDVLKSASATDDDYSNRLIADLFSTGMNTDAIEIATKDAIEPFLSEIDAIDDVDSAFQTAFQHKRKGISEAFFSADYRDSSMSIAHVGEGGIRLPRAYYFDDSYSKILEKYREFLSKLLIAGANYSISDADTAAWKILNFEILLAAETHTPVEARNVTKVTNFYRWADLDTKFPGIPWKFLAQTAELNESNIGDIVIDHPDFFRRLPGIIRDTPLSTVKDYLRVNFLASAARYLGKRFTDLNFELRQALYGVKADKPRNQKVSDILADSIGNAMGKLYVEKYFPEESKNDVINMVKFILATLRERLIEKVAWMSDATKQKAIEKLEAIDIKMGYPDKWEDFSPLEALLTSNMTFLEKISTISEYSYLKDVQKTINKPTDRKRCYYNPEVNEICFPAAILAEPFYRSPTDSAEKNLENAVLNFASIGAIIGHEIMHGFDDSGRLFGPSGNLQDWWTPEDAFKYTTRSELIIKQFDNYQVLGKNISGALTAGENIADLGGVVTSFYAMKKALKENSGHIKDGLTNEQRFFVSFAETWKELVRDELVLQNLEDDPHSPGKFRCNGALSNMVEFYEAFEVGPGQEMYRDNRIEIF